MKQRVKDLPADRTLNTHWTEQHMDRRLKIYREQNVHESGTSVQDFFAKAISTVNGGSAVSDNVKVLNAFLDNEGEILLDL